MYDQSYNNGPFEGLFSIAEAAYLWRKDESTIRKAISSGRLIPGIDCRKFGKQWVVTYWAMFIHFGPLGEKTREKYCIPHKKPNYDQSPDTGTLIQETQKDKEE